MMSIPSVHCSTFSFVFCGTCQRNYDQHGNDAKEHFRHQPDEVNGAAGEIAFNESNREFLIEIESRYPTNNKQQRYYGEDEEPERILPQYTN